MSPEPSGEERATGEGQELAPYTWHLVRSKHPPLTDRVALGSQKVACETRSPLPSRRGEERGGPRLFDEKTTHMTKSRIAVVGGGPAGLMAAETLARAGAAVTLYDRMPNPGRKFLLAGRGGLNLTHSEPLPEFLDRYGADKERLRTAIEAFPPTALRAWAQELGQETFVGSSGRVFPHAMKASPLLRAWLARLGELGVRLQRGLRWTGWDVEGALAFVAADGRVVSAAVDATVLALGGASWPRLGSDGGWTQILTARGVVVTPLQPANCGVGVAWSTFLRERFAGAPLKRIAVSVGDARQRGEAVVTAEGLEGGAIYALGPVLRERLAAARTCSISLDLRPDLDPTQLTAALARPRGKLSLGNHLRKVSGLSPVAIALLHEGHGKTLPAAAAALAVAIKTVPLTVTGLSPIARAISTAGGIAWDALDPQFMLKALPGVFAAGEMIDWDAPTGGYLLQACFATGAAAARGALAFVDGRAPEVKTRGP